MEGFVEEQNDRVEGPWDLESGRARLVRILFFYLFNFFFLILCLTVIEEK